MCNFNTSHVNVNLYYITLNYIIELISIHLMLMLISPLTTLFEISVYFNTSHVNVNLICDIFFIGLPNFNTSHVNVNRIPLVFVF